MKITILGAFTDGLIESFGADKIILDVANKAKNPDTEIEYKNLGKGLTHVDDGDIYAFHLFCETTMLMGMYEEQNKGADALVMGCFYDPALLAVRGVVNLPVIGSAEAAMHLACSMGEKFGIVTPNYECQHVMLRNSLTYGLRNRMIDNRPIRCIKRMNWAEVDPSEIINSFKDTVRGLADDGAEVVILGCWAWIPTITALGIHEVDGIPLIDPCIAAIKYAELFGGLKKSGIPWISRKSMYRTPPKDHADKYFSQWK
ncbi:MAG TPA: aspartate/glutamate racemase family protein [Deltaproteobacteria bacterium]|jgi:allantoin racemase|nr:aspartate/glutamate racemase family protein [Deltaproteobacteria bacterium]HQI00345.1 aspartate/glutamate racemase family protein [Deltaproteobacteria bacterium]